MNEDIVSLLEDLGKDNSVDVIAQFLLRNPHIEDLVATKMGSILSTTEGSSENQNESRNTLSIASSLIPNNLSLAFSGLGNSSHKMIFVVNMDLNMGRGKQCAQVAHAALGLYLKIQQSNNDGDQLKIYQWLSMGQKKIVVRGNDLSQLKTVQSEAEKANLPTILISDAGCTQVAPGSETVLGIFGSNEELDKITRHLKLL